MERLAGTGSKRRPYDRFLEIYREEVEYGEGNPDTRINTIYDDAKKLLSLIDAEHHDILWKSLKGVYPCKWMDKAILKRFRIADFLNGLDKYHRAHPATVEKKHEGKEYAAFMTDADFYKTFKTFMPKPCLSEKAIREYIAAFRKMGALVLIEKRGQHGIPVYALGYYTGFEYNNKPMYKRFLTKELSEKLKEFAP